MSKPRSEFQKYVRKFMLDHDLNSLEFGERIGYSRSTVSNLLSGSHKIPAAFVKAVVEEIGDAGEAMALAKAHNSVSKSRSYRVLVPMSAADTLAIIQENVGYDTDLERTEQLLKLIRAVERHYKIN